jgi:Uma2 family endonuclease
MTAMSTAETTLGLPAARPLTHADLAHLPDDGRRYELVDGVLVVSPSPRAQHQRAVLNLLLLLHAACPDDLEVFVSPLDVKLSDDTVLIPDLVVSTVAGDDDRFIDGAPLVAVEVLSPSTRSFDLHTKKERLREAGCPHYWVVDPGLSGREPTMTAWRLEAGAYVEAGRAGGAEVLTLTDPFAVEVVPAALVAR